MANGWFAARDRPIIQTIWLLSLFMKLGFVPKKDTGTYQDMRPQRTLIAVIRLLMCDREKKSRGKIQS
jgi:hypothetical protein